MRPNQRVFSFILIAQITCLTLGARAETGPADCVIGISNAGKNNRIASDGSANQYTGIKTDIDLTLVIDKRRLRESEGSQATIKRAGFMGTSATPDSSAASPYNQDLSLSSENDNFAYFPAHFSVETDIMADLKFNYKIAFFAESAGGHYYWLKARDGSDFEINSATDPSLRYFSPNLSCFAAFLSQFAAHHFFWLKNCFQDSTSNG